MWDRSAVELRTQGRRRTYASGKDGCMLPQECEPDRYQIATLGVIVMKSAGMMCLLSLIVVISVEFSFEKVTLCRTHPGSEARQDLLSCFSAWDGEHYVRIAREGYDWRPDRRSNVAFFPAYPALGAMIHRLTGCRAELALLCVSHAAFFGCFVVLSLYINDRFVQQSLARRASLLLCFVSLRLARGASSARSPRLQPGDFGSSQTIRRGTAGANSRFGRIHGHGCICGMATTG